MKTATVVGEKSLVETNNKGEQCLIVRLLTSKSYNKEAFTTAMRKHWRPIFKLSDCWDLDEHTLCFRLKTLWIRRLFASTVCGQSTKVSLCFRVVILQMS